MKQSISKQTLPFANGHQRTLNASGRTSWPIRAAITTVYILLSTAAWADNQRFELAGFDGISVAEGIHMRVTSGDNFEVTAESDDARQLERLNVEVRGGVLSAQMDDGLLSPNWVTGDKVTINVTLPTLTQVDAASGADFIADVMNGQGLEVVSSGGARVQINAVMADALSVNASSGAHIDVAGGTCQSLSASVLGGAQLDMKNVACADVVVDARQGSFASVHASMIEADVLSGANVQVFGSPEHTTITVSGGGTIDIQ